MARKRSATRKRPTSAQIRARRRFVVKYANRPKRKRRQTKRVPAMAKTRKRRRRPVATAAKIRRRPRYSAAPRGVERRRRRRGFAGLSGAGVKLIPDKRMALGIGAAVAGILVGNITGKKLAGMLTSQPWAATPGGQAAINAAAAIGLGFFVGKVLKKPEIARGMAIGGAATALANYVYTKLPASLQGLGLAEPGGIQYFNGLGMGSNYALPTVPLQGSEVGTSMQGLGSVPQPIPAIPLGN